MYFPADIVQKRTGENWKYNPSVDDIIKTETVPANMRPAVNGDPSIGYPGNNFTPNPIKHWRKQRVPTFDAQDFTRSNTLENTFEIPGGTTVRQSSSKDCTICKDQTEVPSVNITYRPKNNINNKVGRFYPPTFADHSDYVNQCAANTNPLERCVSICDPEKKARMAVRYPSVINTNNSKPKYYTSNASYLQARCKTYKQNNFQYGTADVSKCQNLVQPNAFRPNCIGCSNCENKGICQQKVSYYKPNNCKFAVQGAVSSSGRIARLKLDTINRFAAGFNTNTNFGPNVANAYAYSSNSEAPFTIKNKIFKCSQNAGNFRKNGNPNVKC